MEKFTPKISPTMKNIRNNFGKMWMAIILLFLATLFGIIQYNKGVKVHTISLENDSRQNARLDILERHH